MSIAGGEWRRPVTGPRRTRVTACPWYPGQALYETSHPRWEERHSYPLSLQEAEPLPARVASLAM